MVWTKFVKCDIIASPNELGGVIYQRFWSEKMNTRLVVGVGSPVGALIEGGAFGNALNSFLGENNYQLLLGTHGGASHTLVLLTKPADTEKFFQQAASWFVGDNEETFGVARRMAGLYTEAEVTDTVEQLVAVAEHFEAGTPEVEMFIGCHSWTCKYLSHFAEADMFRRLLLPGNVRVSVDQEDKRYRAYRSERNLPQQLVATVTPEGVDVSQVFRFEELPGGYYWPLNR
jgi:hypothetical protein